MFFFPNDFLPLVLAHLRVSAAGLWTDMKFLVARVG